MVQFRAVACVVLGLTAPLTAQAQQQPPTPTVGVITAEKRPVSQAQKFVGRIEAVERVDLRARVTGFLEEVLFKDGERVKRGTPLYRIERPPFEASLANAQATAMRARAELDNATLQRQRTDVLVKTSAVSQAQHDDRVTAEKAAQGVLASAEAAQKTAEIQLGYTEILSPIDGEVGRSAVTRGNVVGPDSGVLATIVSIDPMYVTFPVSQREFIRLAEQRPRPTNQNDYHYSVSVQFSNGTVYPEKGKVNFVDVKVDRATDTVTVRATLPNPQRNLIDGQLVEVSIAEDKPEERVLIPASALIADQQGPYVFIVDNGKVAIRRLKLGQQQGAMVIVNEGLSGGEQIVMGGAMSLRPGVAVNTVPAEKPLGG